ncbi:MAG: hypothetical protein H6502_02070 [Candidatus Woesearchaeota archaeon]|nr:MAG: hypothetical protein H6502_02070 [Candidatus Woesearchaeota archaeon]
MDRRAQIAMIFTFLFAIIVIGALVLTGFYFINKLFVQECDVDVVRFKNSLFATLQDSKSYGSVAHPELRTPCDYQELCFIAPEHLGDYSFTVNDNIYPLLLMQDSARSFIKQNIFLVGDYLEPIGYYPDISLAAPEGYSCILTQSGVFPLHLRGQGRVVGIENE